MQQQFSTRNYSIRDFEEWDDRGELELAPKFQRRSVWQPKAKSYLIDTIMKGKPIPKLYMRQNVSPSSRKTKREIVDGQQRLRTALSFIKDGFRLSKAHDKEKGGRFYSQLEPSTQRDILKYEFVVDLLQDMPDNEVYDLFARINTYAEKLKPQELRNASFFGEFKTSVYELAKTHVGFLEKNKVFTPKQILRMAEAEFISELLLAMEEGIREGKRSIITNAYRDYDDKFPNRARHEKRFAETVDAIGEIVGDELPELRFRAAKLFYPLFCAVYHAKYRMSRLAVARPTLRSVDFPKVKTVLEEIDTLIDGIEDGTHQATADERAFFDAQNEHWVHVQNRTAITSYICRQLTKATK